MSARFRWLVLAFALAGLACASESTWVHYRLMTDPTFISPCDLTATVNCTQAYLSPYGSVWGVPVALGGVAWFALVALVAAFARPPASGDAAGTYVFALSIAGLAGILRLAYASYVILKVVCLLCLGTYVCVLGIFVTSVFARSMPIARLPGRLSSDLRTLVARPLALVVALLYLGGVASAMALFPREMRVAATTPAPSGDQDATFAAAWVKQPRLDLGIPADGARVVIVKFNDWLCPVCKAFHSLYAPVLEKYAVPPGTVKYVVRDFPLSPNCNASMAGVKPGHESSCEAAAAVRMARARGKADQMIDWLFTNQDHLVDLNLRHAGGAQAIKDEARAMLGVTDFDREYQAQLPAIRQDVADGVALQIGSTPTFFVNGIRTTVAEPGPRFGQNLPPEYFDLGIRIELGQVGPSAPKK